MSFTEELRRQPRIAYTEEVLVGQDGIFSRTGGRIRNISAIGAFIENAASFAAGSIVSLRFPLVAESEPISCSAIVRNARDGGLGVEFLDLSSEARVRIAAFVSKQSVSARA